jgi:hypothetical protein
MENQQLLLAIGTSLEGFNKHKQIETTKIKVECEREGNQRTERDGIIFSFVQ